MNPVGVSVTRRGTSANAENDGARLGTELNLANHYSVTFTGIWIHSHDSGTNYVIRDSDKKICIVQLNEITVTTLAPVLA
jgi:hypothetical protein